MITTPTVLVLGAGASVPFKYPTGKTLKNKILGTLDLHQTQISKLYPTLGYQKDDIIKFRNALRFSGKSSIDAFLEHRKEFEGIGKVAIAQALMEYEQEGTLFNVGDWYEYFYNLLNASLDEFDKNEIRIITFNYDRSLEHFLFTALLNSYGITEDECAVKMESVPIIHVHGQLGPLPWQDKTSGRKYTPSDNAKDIGQAANGIKIIHEDIDVDLDEKFLEAREALK